jgi:pSer/pThr/pTyr-binding forkhead associated (FHA) protein
MFLEGVKAVSLGSSARAHLCIEHEDVDALHARVIRKEHKWFLVDARSRNHTWVNEQELTRPLVLRGGERIRLGRGVAFVFEDVPFWPDGVPFVPERLPASAEEEERFAILSDWLQESGNPFGAWMQACERGQPWREKMRIEREAWLGPLALEARRGQVLVKWRWGFFESAAVLGPPADGHDLLDQLGPLFQLPQGRLLERLYIDRRQFRGPLQPKEDHDAMRLVLKATEHPRLEEIVVRVNERRLTPMPIAWLKERYPRLKWLRFTTDDERQQFVPMHAVQSENLS